MQLQNRISKDQDRPFFNIKTLSMKSVLHAIRLQLRRWYTVKHVIVTVKPVLCDLCTFYICGPSDRWLLNTVKRECSNVLCELSASFVHCINLSRAFPWSDNTSFTVFSKREILYNTLCVVDGIWNIYCQKKFISGESEARVPIWIFLAVYIPYPVNYTQCIFYILSTAFKTGKLI